jgi:hypothetical protein
MTKKETSNFLFGLFSVFSGIGVMIWAANVNGLDAFFIGAGWVVLINVVSYLIDKRMGA